MLNTGDAAAAPQLRRQHGFQLPLHPLQVSGWLVLAILSVGAFLVLVPALPAHAQPACLATLTTLLLLHLAAHLIAAFVDPAESALRTKTLLPIPILDRTKHAHAIEEGRCNLCDICVTSQRTKHCRVCNKCVAHFDHHCKWLNHCVGGRNYAPFLMCISTAVAAAALVAILAVAEIALHHSHWLEGDKIEGPLTTENSTTATIPTQTSSLPTGDAAFLAVVAALGILAAITAGLLLHLCFFHIYISFLGLTTYEYIRQQRQNQNQTPNQVQESNEEGNDEDHRCSTLRHRPINLHCNGRTRTTLVTTCTVLEETFTSCAEPTPTPPTTPQGCQVCVSNAIAPETQQPKKFKNKWNCCLGGVPDSPDSPNEPKCLLNLCKHKMNKGIPAITTRSNRTHGHWSSAKLRVFFRVLGNLGQNRRRHHHQQQSSGIGNNQVVPLSNDTSTTTSSTTITTTTTTTSSPEIVQTVNNLVPVPCYPEVGRRANALPSLSNPPRRRLVSEMELANALTILQQQQQQQQQQQRCNNRRNSIQYRRRRRSVVHRPKTPTLSPIRESGLSNPASPSHQNCTVAAISGSCTRPI